MVSFSRYFTVCITYQTPLVSYRTQSSVHVARLAVRKLTATHSTISPVPDETNPHLRGQSDVLLATMDAVREKKLRLVINQAKSRDMSFPDVF